MESNRFYFSPEWVSYLMSGLGILIYMKFIERKAFMKNVAVILFQVFRSICHFLSKVSNFCRNVIF